LNTVAHPGRGAAIAAGLIYAALWGGSIFYLFANDNEDWVTGALVMAIFGLALSGIAWLLTRGADAPAIEVRRPAVESGAVLIYLALYAVLFLGYGMTAARAAFPAGPQQELLVMAAKLVVHVVLPASLLVLLGARLAPLVQTGLTGRKFWRTFVVLGAIFIALLCVISPSLQEIAATNAPLSVLAWAAPASFMWIAVEAGLNEEFLFRGVLQTRLSALFRSPWAGVLVTALLFAIAHAPGLFLRGGPDVDGWSTDPLQVIAYTFAVLSPMGLLFGLIYARTKSLLLVVLLHASVDVLPNLAEFINTWT
jgi:membrane protease YdiL (CAAX protease family)